MSFTRVRSWLTISNGNNRRVRNEGKINGNNNSNSPLRLLSSKRNPLTTRLIRVDLGLLTRNFNLTRNNNNGRNKNQNGSNPHRNLVWVNSSKNNFLRQFSGNTVNLITTRFNKTKHNNNSGSKRNGKRNDHLLLRLDRSNLLVNRSMIINLIRRRRHPLPDGCTIFRTDGNQYHSITVNGSRGAVNNRPIH